MNNNSFDKTFEFIKKYRWNSIFVTQLKRAVLIILIPFILVGTLFIYYQNKISLTNTQSILSESFSSSCNVIKNTLKNFNSQKQIIQIDPNIKILMTHDEPNTNTENLNRALHTVKQNIANITLSINDIDCLSLYSIHNDMVFSNKTSGHISSLKTPVWYNEFKKTNNPDFILNYKPDDSNSEHLLISSGYYANSKLYGLIVFDFNIDELISSSFGSNKTTYSEIIISSHNGKIYYNQKKEAEISENISSFLKGEENIRKNGNKLLFKTKFEETDLTVATVNNLDKLAAGSSGIIIYFILIILLILILTIILSMYLSFQFYDTIAKIMAKINEFDTENIKPQYENEITYITQNIASFFFKTQEIEEQLAQNFCELKKAQNLALQAQFNPHFIFNVLNLINIKVIKYTKNGDNEASRMIALLSVLLRSAINPNEYIVSISEELDYAKKFIEIESICLNNNFDVFIEADEEVTSYFTAKFILQPIIENAFQHGIKLLDNEQGYIKIQSFSETDEVIFKVINNTPVLDKEKIEKAQQSLINGTVTSGSHIGLYNVNQRIKMLFGEKYGCKFDSKNGITTVTVKLPIIKNKEI